MKQREESSCEQGQEEQSFLSELTNDVQAITTSLEEGAKKYGDSTEVHQLERAVNTLIAELQFHGIHPI